MESDPGARQITAILTECIYEDGFQLPIYWCQIGANGGLCVIRFTEAGEGKEGLEATALAEHYPHRNITFPLNVLITDSRGKGKYIVFEAPSLRRDVQRN
jgi:hypothetical protein